MLQNNNIILLQKLFDKYIYSTFTEEEELITLSAAHRMITTELDWTDIHKDFPTKESFSSSVQIYSKTVIQLLQKGGFDSYSLVTRCQDMGNSVRISHVPAGLRLYLYRQPSAMICNSHFQEIFIRAFERYNIRGGALYSLLSKGYQNSCTPEELKELLEVNYINSMLKVRVLSPAEKIVRELFDAGIISFYFKVEVKRSVIGRGSKIIEFQFNVIDNLVLLRQKRKRPVYMKFIMSQLTELFPFDYPFLEESINTLGNKEIEQIHIMIRDIKKDPDYKKMATSTLVKYKIQQIYKVKFPASNFKTPI